MSDEAEFIVKLIDQVSAGANSAGNSVKKLTIDFGSAGDEAEHASGVMDHAFGEIVAHAVEFAAEKIFEFGKEAAVTVIEAADHAQRASIAFDQLAKHGASGAKIFQFARETAAELGMDVNDTVHAFEHFLAMQFNPKQAEALVKMGADLQAIGVNAEQTQSIFHQFAQIKSLGKLGMGSLTNLAQSGVSEGLVIDALVERLGKTPDEIKKMLSKGAISAEDGLNAIGDAIKHKTHENEFGEAGRRVAESTLSGLFGQLKAGAQNAILDLGQTVAPDLQAAFSAVIKAVSGSMGDGTGAGFLKAIADGIKAVAGIVRDAAPAIAAFIKGFGGGAVQTFTQFTSAWKASVPGPDSAAKFLELGKTLGQLAAAVVAGGLVIVDIFGRVVMGANALWMGIKGSLEAIVNGVGGFIFAIVDTFANISAIFDSTGMSWGEKLFAIGGQLMTGLANGIKAAVMTPINAITSIGTGMIDATKALFDQHSPSKVFEDIGAMNVEGLALGHKPMNDVIDTSVPAPSAGIGGAFAGGMGGANVEVNVTQQISVVGGDDPKATAREIHEMSLDDFGAALEEANIETAA